MSWYLKVLKSYAVFGGRARRKEYWYFVLFNTLISVGLGVIDALTGSYSLEAGLGILSGVYLLLILIPSIAVAVRRLHDTGRPAWWLLILLLPVLGAIIFLVFMILDSDEGENAYGPSPKAVAA